MVIFRVAAGAMTVGCLGLLVAVWTHEGLSGLAVVLSVALVGQIGAMAAVAWGRL